MPIFSTLDRLSTLSKDYDGSGLSPLSCCCCDWFAVHKHKVLELPDWKDHTGKGLRLQVAGCRLQVAGSEMVGTCWCQTSSFRCRYL